MLKPFLVGFLLLMSQDGGREPEHVRKLIDSLVEKTSSYDARDPRFKEIVKLGDRALPPLLQICRDGGQSVRTRNYALLAIQHIGLADPPTVKGLTEIFKTEKDPTVKRYILLALSNIVSPEICGEIVALYQTENDRELKSFLRTIIASIGGEKSIAFLVNGLKNGSGEEQRAMLKEIARMRLPDAIPHLLAKLDEAKEDLRSELVAVLGEVTGIPVGKSGSLEEYKQKWGNWWKDRQRVSPKAEPGESVGEDEAQRLLRDLTDVDQSVKSMAERQILDKGRGMLPHLKQLSAAEPDSDRTIAMAKLIELIEWGVGSSLYATDNTILDKLKSTDIQKRLTVITSVKERKDRRYRKVFERLLNDSLAEIREQAVEALGNLEDKISAPLLIKLLEDPNDNVRVAVIEAISKNLGDEDNVVYVENGNSVRRKQGGGDSDRIVGELVKLLFDRSLTVRIAACEALGDMKAEMAMDDLSLALKDPDWRMRAKAAEVMGKIRSGDAAKYLSAALRDEDPFVKAEALKAISRLESEKAIPHVLEVIRREKAGKEIYLDILRKMKYVPAHAQEIVKLAGEVDGATRLEFVRYLAENREMAAAPLLATLLKQGTPEERITALQAFASIQAGDILPLAKEFLKHNEPAFRIAALNSIIPNDSNNVNDYLLMGLKDPSPEVRSFTLWLIPKLLFFFHYAIDIEATKKAAEKEGKRIEITDNDDRIEVTVYTLRRGTGTSFQKSELEDGSRLDQLSYYGVIVAKKPYYLLSKDILMPAIQEIKDREPLSDLLRSGALVALGDKDDSHIVKMTEGLRWDSATTKFWTYHGLTGGMIDLAMWVILVIAESRIEKGINALDIVTASENRDVKRFLVKELSGIREGKPILIKLAYDDAVGWWISLAALKTVIDKGDTVDILKILIKANDIPSNYHDFLAKNVTEEMVPYLIDLLSVTDSDDNEFVASLILGILKKENLSLLTDRLKKIDPSKEVEVKDLRRAANGFKILAKFNDKRASDALLPFIRSKEDGLKIPALDALCQIDEESAKPILLEFLNDPSSGVVIHALRKLRGSTDPRYAAALKSIMDGEPSFAKVEAASIMMEGGDPNGEKIMISFLDDPATFGRALEYLRNTTDPAILPHLRKFLMSASERSQSIYYAMEILQRIDHEEARNLVMTLINNGPPSIDKDELLSNIWYKTRDKKSLQPMLISLVKGADESAKSASIRLLGELWGTENIALIRPFLKDPSVSVKASAMSALGKLKDVESIPIIAQFMGKPSSQRESSNLSYSAISALAAIGTYEALSHLVPFVKDKEMGEEVVQYLAEAREPRLVPELIKYAGDADKSVAMSAIKILSGYRSVPAVIPIFTAMLAGDNSETKMIAIDILSEMKNPALVKPLIHAYESATINLKIKILKAITRMGGKDAVPLLRKTVSEGNGRLAKDALKGLLLHDSDAPPEIFLNVLNGDNANLKRYALRYFALQWDDRAYPAALSALDDENGEIALEAVNAIGFSGKKEAVSKLLAMAKTGPIELKVKIMEALARLDREALLPMLKEDLTADAFVLTDKAIDLLYHGGYAETVELLQKLSDHKDHRLRNKALEYLLRLNRPLAVEKLKKLLSESADSDDEEEVYTIVAIEKVTEVGDILFQKLEHVSKRSAVSNIVHTLSNIGYKLTNDQLRRFSEEERDLIAILVDRPTPDKKALIKILEQPAQEKVVEQPMRELFRTPDGRVFVSPTGRGMNSKLDALMRLSDSIDAGDLPFIRSLLKGGDNEIRLRAAEILAMWGEKDGIEIIKQNSTLRGYLLLKQNGEEVPPLRRLVEEVAQRNPDEYMVDLASDGLLSLRYSSEFQSELLTILSKGETSEENKKEIATLLAACGVAEGRQWFIGHPEDILSSNNARKILDILNSPETTRLVGDLLLGEMRMCVLRDLRQGERTEPRGNTFPMDEEDPLAYGSVGWRIDIWSPIYDVMYLCQYSDDSPSFEPRSMFQRAREWWKRSKDKSERERKIDGIAAAISLLNHVDPDVRVRAHNFLNRFTLQEFPYDSYAVAAERTSQAAAWKSWWEKARDRSEQEWFIDAARRKAYIADGAGFQISSPEGVVTLGNILRKEENYDSPLLKFAIRFVEEYKTSYLPRKGTEIREQSHVEENKINYLPALIEGLGNKNDGVRAMISQTLMKLTGKDGGENPHLWRKLLTK